MGSDSEIFAAGDGGVVAEDAAPAPEVKTAREARLIARHAAKDDTRSARVRAQLLGA